MPPPYFLVPSQPHIVPRSWWHFLCVADQPLSSLNNSSAVTERFTTLILQNPPDIKSLKSSPPLCRQSDTLHLLLQPCIYTLCRATRPHTHSSSICSAFEILIPLDKWSEYSNVLCLGSKHDVFDNYHWWSQVWSCFKTIGFTSCLLVHSCTIFFSSPGAEFSWQNLFS